MFIIMLLVHVTATVTTLLEIVKLMEIFDMKIVDIKFVEIVTEGKFLEIKIRRNKMIYSMWII